MYSSVKNINHKGCYEKKDKRLHSDIMDTLDDESTFNNLVQMGHKVGTERAVRSFTKNERKKLSCSLINLLSTKVMKHHQKVKGKEDN